MDKNTFKEFDETFVKLEASDLDFNLFKQAEELMKRKHEDYGTNISKYAKYTIAANIFNKSTRLCNLIYNDKQPNFESIDDTLIDLISYVVLLKTTFNVENKNDK